MAWRHTGSQIGLQNSTRLLMRYIQHSVSRIVKLHAFRIVVAIAVLLALGSFIQYLRFRNLNWDFEDEDSLGHVRNPGLKHDKWIVVTTVQHPTEAVKALNLLQGWKLIVVGDRKTPSNWDLKGVTYLSPAAQKKLAYKVHPLLQYDTYTRKIIGYLYAIEHGAEYIYETDDDNLPLSGPDSFQLSIGYTESLIVSTNNLTYNHHKHFGQSTTWPRGYPLEYVGLADSRDYILCETYVPAIQQGVTTGDPDLDAIFRLTRTHGNRKIDIRFDSGAPPVILPKGTFGPQNAQNTLFTAKAFWAMVLPTTVSDRATDIYRAYWAQRLLWLLGDSIGYFPPFGHHNRNPHSLLMDAKDEMELYQNVGHLIRFLHGWSCDALFFFDCASRLAHDMVRYGFWMKRDAELIDAWITDLATIGYAPPSMKVRDMCVDDKKKTVIFYPYEQNTTFPHTSAAVLTPDLTNHAAIKELIASTCHFGHEINYELILNTATKHENILLVVGIRDTDVVPLIEAVHRRSFSHILYCSARNLNPKFFHAWKLSYVATNQEELTATTCMLTAMAMHYHVDGYLYISDHAWIGPDLMGLPLKFPNLMWITGEVDIYKPEMETACQQRSIDCMGVSKDLIEQFISQVPSLPGETKFKSELRQCLVKMASDPQFVTKAKLLWLTDYTFYLPTRLYEMLTSVNKLFSSSRMKQKYDFLAPVLVECLELTAEYLKYAALEYLEQSSQSHYLLPFSFRDIIQNKQTPFKSYFCKHFAGHDVA